MDSDKTAGISIILIKEMLNKKLSSVFYAVTVFADISW